MSKLIIWWFILKFPKPSRAMIVLVSNLCLLLTLCLQTAQPQILDAGTSEAFRKLEREISEQHEEINKTIANIDKRVTVNESVFAIILSILIPTFVMVSGLSYTKFKEYKEFGKSSSDPTFRTQPNLKGGGK